MKGFFKDLFQAFYRIVLLICCVPIFIVLSIVVNVQKLLMFFKFGEDGVRRLTDGYHQIVSNEVNKRRLETCAPEVRITFNFFLKSIGL